MQSVTMENCGFDINYWEFKIRLSTGASTVLSNSLMVNLICATFGGFDDRLVVKISTAAGTDLIIIVLTRSTVAEKNLLKNFSVNRLKEELNEAVTAHFVETEVKDVLLTHTGYLSRTTNQEFETCVSEAQMVLSSLGDDRRHEVLFTSFESIISDNRLIKAPLSKDDTTQLINGILQKPYGEIDQARMSSSTFQTVRNFVTSWLVKRSLDSVRRSGIYSTPSSLEMHANPSFDGSGASTDGGEAREVFDEKSLNPNLQDFKEESDEMLTAAENDVIKNPEKEEIKIECESNSDAEIELSRTPIAESALDNKCNVAIRPSSK